MDFKDVIETVGVFVDGAGVLVIVAGLLVALIRFAAKRSDGYPGLRHDLGRGILLGLEFLVAADIIRTVAVSPTLQSLAILAAIVLIRTFLSMALEVELEGRLPWKRSDKPGARQA